MSSAVPSGTSRRQKTSAGCGLTAIWGFVVMWYGFLALFVVLIRRDHSGFSGPAIILGVFMLAGLLPLVAAIGATRDAFRFRGTELDLQTSPAVLGGKISGTFRVPERVLNLTPLEARVVNFRRRRGRHSGPDEMLWDTSEPVGQPFKGADGFATLPFSIRLPYDVEPTSYNFYWQVELRAGKKGGMFFTVETARTAQSSEAQTKVALRPAAMAAPAETEVKIERTVSGVDLEMPAPSWAWKWFVFLVVASVIGVIGANLILTRLQAPANVFLIAYAVVGVAAILFGGVSVLSLAMYVRRLQADRSGVEIQYAFSGRKPKRVKREELADVATSYSSARYSIDLVRADRTPMFGNLMPVKTRHEAEWIASELRRAIFGANQPGS